jgi:hypothetical protein
MLEEYTPHEWLREGDLAFESDYVWDHNKVAKPAVVMTVGDSGPFVIFTDEIEGFLSSFAFSLTRFAKEAEKLASSALYEDEFDV